MIESMLEILSSDKSILKKGKRYNLVKTDKLLQKFFYKTLEQFDGWKDFNYCLNAI